MAVSEQTGFDESTASGMTGVFPYTFKILRAQDMRVEIDGVLIDGLGAYTYEISGIGEDAGGNVTITPNPTAGAIVLRALDSKLDRTTNYQYAGDLKSPVVNADFDRLWLAMQLVKRRALMLPLAEIGNNVLSAGPSARANKALIFDENGAPVVSEDNYNDQAANAALSAAQALASKNAAVISAAEAEESASRVDLGALDQAVTDSTAQAVIATTQAGIATTEAGNSTAAKIAAQAAQALSESARDAALLSRGLWQTTAQGIGNGVAGTASLVAGSGGTNGTFALAFSGGTQVIAPKGYFVVAGGVVTQVVMTYAGHYSAGTPTLSFAASAGLSGASATAVMGANTPIGQYFSVPVTGSNASLILYRVDTGPVATEITRYPSITLFGMIDSVMLGLNSSAIKLDLEARELKIIGTCYIYSVGTVSTVPTQTLSLPTTGAKVQLVYDNVTKVLSFKALGINLGSSETKVGTVYGSVYTVLSLNGNSEYTVKTPAGGVEMLSADYLTTLTTANTNQALSFVTTAGEGPTYSTTTEILKLTGRLYFSGSSASNYIPCVADVVVVQGKGLILYLGASNSVGTVAANAGALPHLARVIGTYDTSKGFFDIGGLPVLVDGVYQGAKGGPASYVISPSGNGYITLHSEALDVAGNWAPYLEINSCRVVGPHGTRLLTNASIPIPTPTLMNPMVLVLDPSAWTMRFQVISDLVGQVTKEEYILGVLSGKRGAFRLSGGFDYNINSKGPAHAGRDSLWTSNLLAPISDLTSNYELAAPLDGFEWITAAVHQSIYDRYDALVLAHPEYVTKVLLGEDTIGNSIYRYDFKPPINKQGAKFPKVILTSGHHGYEKAGVYVALTSIEEICNNWEASSALEKIRWGVHFIVIPVVCPYGFDNNTRINENGVDPDRNYIVGWDKGSDDTTGDQYRGPSPLSEPSAQYVTAVLEENSDAVYYCSFHNFQNDTIFIWNAAASPSNVTLANTFSREQTLRWSKKYAWAVAGQWLGYSDLTAPTGSSPMTATRVYNIPASTFEISRTATMAGDPTLWGPLVATLGTEAFINWVIVCIKQGIEIRNSSVRIAG